MSNMVGIRARMRRLRELNNLPLAVAAQSTGNRERGETDDPRVRQIITKILDGFKPPERTQVIRMLLDEQKSLGSFTRDLHNYVAAEAGPELELGILIAQFRLANNAGLRERADAIARQIDLTIETGEPRIPNDTVSELTKLAIRHFPPRTNLPQRG